MTDAHVFHQHEMADRPASAAAYRERLLALDLFIGEGRVAGASRAWFVWSLVGNLLFHACRGNRDMRAATAEAMGVVLARRNPYASTMTSAPSGPRTPR